MQVAALYRICLLMVGKPKAQRGQVTRPWPHSEQPPTNGKGHLLQLLLDVSHLRQLEAIACPGPGAVFVNSAAPRGSALGQGERAARPSLTRLPACGPLSVHRPASPVDPGRPRSPAAERFRTRLPFRSQTSPPAPFTFLGGLQQLSLLCPQPILLRGLPDSASQLWGPQRSLPSEPRCPLGARRPGQPARP